MKKTTILFLSSLVLCSCNGQANNPITPSNDDISESIENKESNESVENSESSKPNFIPTDVRLLKEPTLTYNNVDTYDSDGYSLFLNKLGQYASTLTDNCVNFYEEADKENFTISPLSIYMAFALATECANNNTRDELLDSLGMSYSDVSKYTKTLYQKSLRNIVHTDYFTKEETVLAKEKLSNSIWLDSTILSYLKETTLNNLAKNYYCYSYLADFYNNNKSTNKMISEFVKEQTEGLIDNDFNLSKETIIALINTLYMKFNWLENSDGLSYTNKEYDFINTDKTITKTKLLSGTYSSGRAYKDETFSSFYCKSSAPYKLHFILPNEGYSVKDVYTSANINKIINLKDYNAVDEENKIKYYTKCLFPEYKSKNNINLRNMFESKYNMNSFFNGADFTNLLEESYPDNVYCGSIIHSTKLDVAKQGVEGAAVTIIAMEATSTGPDNTYLEVYETLTIDKGFGFIITDASNVVLFSGVVNNI